MLARLLLILDYVLLFVACSQSATTQPTTDSHALETGIAANVFATQTASVPTPDEIANETRIAGNIFGTQTVSASQSTNTPNPTETPKPTNSSATKTPVPAPTRDTSIDIPLQNTYKHTSTITEEYDRFKKETVITMYSSLADSFKGRPHGLVVIYSYPGEKAQIPDKVEIGFSSTYEDWTYLRCHDLTFLIDGEPVSVRSEHIGDVLSGGSVAETVIGFLTPQIFLQMANAKKLEGKICNDEFVFSESQMEALRDTASRMR